MDVNNFREKLKKEIHEYMDMQISSRNVTAITDMIACLSALDVFEDAKDAEHFDMSTAQKWVDGMKNDDGTHGAHWSFTDTEQVRKSRGYKCDPTDFYALINMMYSDYYNTGHDFGVNTPDFYASLAHDFLNDADAQKNKTAKYYACIANHK